MEELYAVLKYFINTEPTKALHASVEAAVLQGVVLDSIPGV